MSYTKRVRRPRYCLDLSLGDEDDTRLPTRDSARDVPYLVEQSTQGAQATETVLPVAVSRRKVPSVGSLKHHKLIVAADTSPTVQTKLTDMVSEVVDNGQLHVTRDEPPSAPSVSPAAELAAGETKSVHVRDADRDWIPTMPLASMLVTFEEAMKSSWMVDDVETMRHGRKSRRAKKEASETIPSQNEPGRNNDSTPQKLTPVSRDLTLPVQRQTTPPHISKTLIVSTMAEGVRAQTSTARRQNYHEPSLTLLSSKSITSKEDLQRDLYALNFHSREVHDKSGIAPELLALDSLFYQPRVEHAGANSKERADAEVMSAIEAEFTADIVAEITPAIDAESTPAIEADTMLAIDAKIMPDIDADITPDIDADIMPAIDAKIMSAIEIKGISIHERRESASSVESLDNPAHELVKWFRSQSLSLEKVDQSDDETVYSASSGRSTIRSLHLSLSDHGEASETTQASSILTSNPKEDLYTATDDSSESGSEPEALILDAKEVDCTHDDDLSRQSSLSDFTSTVKPLVISLVLGRTFQVSKLQVFQHDREQILAALSRQANFSSSAETDDKAGEAEDTSFLRMFPGTSDVAEMKICDFGNLQSMKRHLEFVQAQIIAEA